jgi:signal transduction histidine kinase
LAICKAIVEAHGGQIAVADAPGGGARFCFSLPKVSS